MLENYKIKLAIKTVSPVAIIEGNDTEAGGNIVTRVKRAATISQTDDGKKIDYLPYLPANGIRGVLRRFATQKLVEAVKKNENIQTLKDSDIHAMLSGSGASKAALKSKEIDEIREKNPILSLFGTGILMAGKLKVADAMPDDSTEAKNFVRRLTFVKVDDILMNTKFAGLFSKEQVEEWEESVSQNSAERKKDRENKKLAKEMNEVYNEDERTKKSSIQHFAQKEYIVSKSQFNGGFFLENVTTLELGMFLHALESFVKHGRIGSSQNIGFGVIDIHIEDIDGSGVSFDRIANDNFIYDAKIELDLDGDFKKAYDEYSDFLKNAKREHIELISKF
ncbi:RAMP superfamily CRISPR-associated protein [Campylobacter sp. MOP7]|uniref:RAMP superfamily CRISPR-associated protein n=1 Tax=Campylobacter canis TaxID=3378588 RepID=UPI00387E818E